MKGQIIGDYQVIEDENREFEKMVGTEVIAKKNFG